ncbi:MAG: HlyD family efflux transporter periplasmic adaptor subunit [Desulfamplus sp.]|nr:HlyD family efflux transporter periplasmic adaptor subunit [Desulfamplus sp.]
MEKNKKLHWFIKVIRLVIPILIIAAGIAFAKHLYDTKPVAKRIKPVIPPPLVETISLKSIDHAVVINSMGKVISSQTISLKARVGGFVIETSPEFIQGGIYRKGDVMLKLDPKDFELVLKQQEAMLQKAEASLKLEMGKQEVARAELRLMQNTSGKPINDTNLALRVPHLEQIKAEIASIKVDIEKARLNIERTTAHAPFNCMVISTNVEIGSQISSQEALATLSGTDEYRIEATVSVDHLKWIDFPANSTRGSDVVITTNDGEKHHGEVIKMLGSLSDKSKLARILIRVEDPLYLKKNGAKKSRELSPKSKVNQEISSNHSISNPLLIDSYVQADIQGKTIENVFCLPRAAVRDGNKIWLVENRKNGRDLETKNSNDSETNNSNAEDNSKNLTLVIKNIDLLWKESESVYIKEGVMAGDTKDGVATGDMLVVSDLSSPAHGMAVKIRDANIKADAAIGNSNKSKKNKSINHENSEQK